MAATATVAMMLACTHTGAGVKNLKWGTQFETMSSNFSLDGKRGESRVAFGVANSIKTLKFYVFLAPMLTWA